MLHLRQLIVFSHLFFYLFIHDSTFNWINNNNTNLCYSMKILFIYFSCIYCCYYLFISQSSIAFSYRSLITVSSYIYRLPYKRCDFSFKQILLVLIKINVHLFTQCASHLKLLLWSTQLKLLSNLHHPLNPLIPFIKYHYLPRRP